MINVAGERTGQTFSITRPGATVDKLNQYTGHVVCAQQAVDYTDAERTQSKTSKLRESGLTTFLKPTSAHHDQASIGRPYDPNDEVPHQSTAPSISAGALPLNMICDVAQHWQGLQRDFKLQLSVLHLQLLHQTKNSVSAQMKQSAEVCTMTAGQIWRQWHFTSMEDTAAFTDGLLWTRCVAPSLVALLASRVSLRWQ